MRVSNEALERHIQILRHMGSVENKGYPPPSLQLRLEVALDLYEARERIKELEATLDSSRTASRHYYEKLTENKEAAEGRIAALEVQLAEAKRVGAAEAYQRLHQELSAMADGLQGENQEFARTLASHMAFRAAELRAEVPHA